MSSACGFRRVYRNKSGDSYQLGRQQWWHHLIFILNHLWWPSLSYHYYMVIVLPLVFSVFHIMVNITLYSMTYFVIGDFSFFLLPNRIKVAVSSWAQAYVSLVIFNTLLASQPDIDGDVCVYLVCELFSQQPPMGVYRLCAFLLFLSWSWCFDKSRHAARIQTWHTLYWVEWCVQLPTLQ